ncbi:DUF6387 family protein [Halomonas elongata]|uniref:DUF6387 family protein n=1 Tax=Halomonas elongata TaxID=2746 RepID=UPI0023AEC94D|nr:DUF6387 family protein [Halomonas elongata]
MSKMIRDVSELPEWFDIRPYEQWEDKDPHEATWAVEDRLSTAWFLYVSCIAGPDRLAEETKLRVMDRLAKSVSEPYRRTNKEMMLDIFYIEDGIRHGKDHAEFRKREYEEQNNIERATLAEAKRILDGSPTRDQEEIRRVTLWDVMNWMEENKDILDELEATAQRLSRENGWDLDEVRSSLQGDIPIWSCDGSDFLDVCDYPTIPAVLKKIERHLKSRPRFSEGASARYADVRKLFDYRVAAYADLMSWCHLTNSTITKKCLANALFPDGRYGEVDMMPSKTVGGFIKRVEDGYIGDLTAKAAEMESMQS